ncbi:MAG TPA: hypothetical protein VGH37_18650 [Candidatus Acidoferrum sp.]
MIQIPAPGIGFADAPSETYTVPLPDVGGATEPPGSAASAAKIVRLGVVHDSPSLESVPDGDTYCRVGSPPARVARAPGWAKSFILARSGPLSLGLDVCE